MSLSQINNNNILNLFYSYIIWVLVRRFIKYIGVIIIIIKYKISDMPRKESRTYYNLSTQFIMDNGYFV